MDTEDEYENNDDVQANKPITDWTNEPTVKELKYDYDQAKSSHEDQVAKIDIWIDNLNTTGVAKVKSKPGRSEHVPQLIRRQAEWRYATISEPFLSTPDVYDITPVTQDDKEQARQNQILINNQFSTVIDKVGFFDDFCVTVVDEGTVIVRVGWHSEEEYGEEMKYNYDVTSDPEEIAIIGDTIRMANEAPEQFEVEVPDELKEAAFKSMEAGKYYFPAEDKMGPTDEPINTKNYPTLTVCDYHNIIIDPTCNGKISDARFVIYSFETSLADLKAAGEKYTNLDKINVKDMTSNTDADHKNKDTSSFDFDDKPRKRFVAYEYWGEWDTEGDGTVKPIVATWVGDVMISMDENPFTDKKPPFVSAQYRKVKGKVYGLPDGALLVDNQKIVGAVTRGMIDLMARGANGQMGVRKDGLDAHNLREFKAGNDFEFNPGANAGDLFHMYKYDEIPAAAFNLINAQNADAESLTGIKAFSNGITGDALGASVGGAKLATDATAKRELAILRRMAGCVEEIGRKVVAMNAVFLNEEEIVRITETEFVPIKRDDLAGNFDLKISISTPEADNAKADSLNFLLQTANANMPQDFTRIILAEICELKNMPRFAADIRNFKPEPDPLEVRKAELEVELLEAELETERGKARGEYTGANLDEAKANTEVAKANNLDSDSDKKDLDFIEQETGVAQERELEKSRGQAVGNIQLEGMKHVLDKDKEDSKSTQ